MRKRIVIIPAYEPDKSMIILLKKISKNNNYDVIVIDDGSGVKYRDVFDEAKRYAKVLQYSDNMGKGYALKYGYKYVKDKYDNNYIVVCMDCDGQHSFKDAVKLCDYVDDNPSDLVLGMRKRGDNTPLRSRIGNYITMGIYRFVTGVDVYDTQTGLRAFSDKLMDYMLSISGNRYEYEMNVLLESVSNNIKIEEIEIETIYIDNNSGSHFDTFRDSIKIYKEIFKFSLSSISSFFIDYILFSLFIFVFNNINISNILARIISATYNYIVNKRMVFNSNKKIYNTFVGYVMLAIIILAVNTMLLNIFVNVFNPFFSKIMVELILFIFSYVIQKKIIFNK